MLEKLRGQQYDNYDITSQASQQQISDQSDGGLTNNNSSIKYYQLKLFVKFKSSSFRNQKGTLVKIRDTSSREISTQKIQADQVWHLERNEKVIVELNGDGQGNDNGSNLLVRFLAKLSQNTTICPISVKSWDRMPEANSRQQWQYVEDIFEFDYAAGIKWVMHTLCERWRAYRYHLRCQHFYPNKRKEDILVNPPSGVDSADWTALCIIIKRRR